MNHQSPTIWSKPQNLQYPRTKWLERMTFAPFWIKCLIVGTAALILVSSVISWLSLRGTFKSALTNTFFPFKSAEVKSPTLFLTIDTTPLTPLPPNDRTLEATLRDKRGSAAEKPRRRRLVERREMEEEVGERWRSEERVWEVEEEVVVGRRERVVGAVAEAMAKCLWYVSEKSERGRVCVCVKWRVWLLCGCGKWGGFWLGVVVGSEREMWTWRRDGNDWAMCGFLLSLRRGWRCSMPLRLCCYYY